jgi:hypothetical protein
VTGGLVGVGVAVGADVGVPVAVADGVGVEVGVLEGVDVQVGVGVSVGAARSQKRMSPKSCSPVSRMST